MGGGRLHGTGARERTCAFGKRSRWCVAKKLRSKREPTWKYGCVAGRSLSSDQGRIVLAGGSTARARSIVRLVPESRWGAEWLLRTKTPPIGESTQDMCPIESEPDPHSVSNADLLDEEDAPEQPARRRVKLTLVQKR